MIREYEETKNLDSGEVTTKFIGEKEILEDKYINVRIPSDQQPIENGTYTIEYIIPTSGKDRGRGNIILLLKRFKI